jgi:hypothetical protein
MPSLEAVREDLNSQTKLVVDARITGPDRVAVRILPQLAANEGASQ